jgi:hypothetical protein
LLLLSVNAVFHFVRDVGFRFFVSGFRLGAVIKKHPSVFLVLS